MASLKSAIALSYSFLARPGDAPVAVGVGAYLGSSRMASLKSAMALSYSFLAHQALPRLL